MRTFTLLCTLWFVPLANCVDTDPQPAAGERAIELDSQTGLVLPETFPTSEALLTSDPLATSCQRNDDCPSDRYCKRPGCTT